MAEDIVAQTPAEYVEHVLEEADRQGRGLVAGWQPSIRKPMPTVRCVVIKKDGQRCQQWSLRGHDKCVKHVRREMNFPNVKEHHAAVIEAARLRLIDDSDAAIDTLEALTREGTADGIRLKAATEILDRAGIRGGYEIDVEVAEKPDPSKFISSRLEQLRARAAERNKFLPDPANTVQSEVIPQEIEPPTQTERLF